MHNQQPQIYNQNITCLACSVFRDQLQQLQNSGLFNLPVVYLDSIMHLAPDTLKSAMDNEIHSLHCKGQCVLLIYGQCHNYMDQYSQLGYVYQLSGTNCIEIIIGTEQYHKLINDGAFFLIYEWARNWKNIFADELELPQNIAKDLMNSQHKYLLYLDTGEPPIPEQLLNEASDFMGLPWKTMNINSNNLINSINSSLATI